MAKVCQISHKRHLVGRKVSHSNIKTKRRFNINLQTRRIFLPEENRFIRLRISAKAIRLIDKLGIERALKLKKR